MSERPVVALVPGLLPLASGVGIGAVFGRATHGSPLQMSVLSVVGGLVAVLIWVRAGGLETSGRGGAGAAMDFLPGFLTLAELLSGPAEPIRAWAVGIGAVLLIVAFLLRRRFGMVDAWLARWGALLAGAVALSVYGASLSPEPGPDSVVLPMLDRADPVSPLHALMGQVIMLFAGDGISGQNFTSALPAALAVIIVAVTVSRLRMGRLLGVLVALAFAFSPDFWKAATRAGYATVTAALVAAILAMSLDALYTTDPIERSPTGDAEPVKTPRRMPVEMVWGMAFIFGLGISHSPTVLPIAPALILAVALSRPRMKLTQWVITAVVFGMGLLPMVAVSGAGVSVRDVEFGQFFGDLLRPDAWRDTDRWLALGDVVLRQYGVAGAVLAVIGMARLARWYPRIGPVTLLAYCAYGLYGLGGGADVADSLIPMHIVQAIWVAYAVHAIGQWLAKYLPPARGIGYVLVHTAFALLPIYMVWANWPRW